MMLKVTIAAWAALLTLTFATEVLADGLSGPEAVRYDPELDVFFVSNFNDEPAGDANGFVSKISPDGDVIVAKFMIGTEGRPFHGGRGMFIDQAGLWVVDAGGVHVFDRHTGEQLDFVDFSEFELGFLNDIVLGKDGVLYVTDTDGASLYKIVDREAVFVTTVPMNPNGITADPNTGRLLLVPWSGGDEIVAWDIDEESFSSVAKLEGGGNYDGIEIVGNTIIVASQMDTSLHLIVNGTDTGGIDLPGKPADMGIDTKRGTIAVPYVALDRVDIIEFAEPSID
jgi:sugar lactone lactonase YvrE